MLLTQEQVLTITDREALSVNKIKKVIGFDSEYVLLECEFGRIAVEGESLAIENLTKDSGDLHITGKIEAVIFSNTKKERHGVFSKLVK